MVNRGKSSLLLSHLQMYHGYVGYSPVPGISFLQEQQGVQVMHHGRLGSLASEEWPGFTRRFGLCSLWFIIIFPFYPIKMAMNWWIGDTNFIPRSIYDLKAAPGPTCADMGSRHQLMCLLSEVYIAQVQLLN